MNVGVRVVIRMREGPKYPISLAVATIAKKKRAKKAKPNRPQAPKAREGNDNNSARGR